MCVEKSIVGLNYLGFGLRVLKPFRVAGGFQNLISTRFYFVGAFDASKIVISLKYLAWLRPVIKIQPNSMFSHYN